MHTVLYFILFMLVLAVHETGHALLMARYGVRIKEICLVGFGPRLFGFKIPQLFGDTPVTIRLLPLGAYVQTVRRIRVQPSPHMHILSGGIAINLMFGGLLGVLAGIIGGSTSYLLYGAAALCFCGGLILWVFVSWAGPLVFALGLLQLVLVGYMFYKGPILEVFGGILTLVDDAAHVMSVSQTLLHVAILSVSLAFINAMPLAPLDGGHIVGVLWKKYLPKHRELGWALKTVSIVAFSLIVILSFSSDIKHYLW